MKKNIRICFLLLMIFPLDLLAQQSISNDSTIRISFRSSGTPKQNTPAKKKKKKSDEENIIKIAPLGFVSGVMPVFYERVVNEFFTIQGGVGITSRNFTRSAFQQASETPIKINYPWGDDYQYMDQVDAPLIFTNRVAKTGFAFSIEPRLYFDSESPDGSYFGASYNFYRYNFNIPGIVSTSSGSYAYKGDVKKEHENISDFMAVFGYHDIGESLTLDYSVGLGIRNVTGTKYYYGTNSTDYLEGITTYKQSIFNVNIGLKIGFHF